MDLLAGGGVGHVLLGAATHVELVDLSQELLGLWGMCGGGVVCHTVQPAMPEEQTVGFFFLYNVPKTKPQLIFLNILMYYI